MSDDVNSDLQTWGEKEAKAPLVPLPQEADASDRTQVQLTITRPLAGSTTDIRTSLCITVSELKDRIRNDEIVTGLFSFKLMTEDATILKDGSAQLLQYGLQDGSNLMLVMGRTRDYSNITQFDAVICNGRYPQGVLTNDRGELFVSYWGGELKVFDSNHELLREHRLPFRPPTQMAFAPSGELLISFTGHCVGAFNPDDLSLVRQFGTPCSSNGIVACGERIFVADSNQHRILVYRLTDGELVDTWTGSSHPSGLEFDHPCGLAALDDRLIAVADRRNHRIRLLDFDGNHVRDIGSGDAPDSQLKSPNDVAVDPDGNLLVLDTQNERIAVFDQEGSLLASVMPGFFKARGNTYSYLSVNQITGAISVSFDDEHKVVILAPLFPAA